VVKDILDGQSSDDPNYEAHEDAYIEKVQVQVTVSKTQVQTCSIASYNKNGNAK
jgi:uncharacterized protein with FMN-binding domain